MSLNRRGRRLLKKQLGLVRIAVANTPLEVGDCEYNSDRIIEAMAIAQQKRVQALFFPELSITAYTIGDLVQQRVLLDGAKAALQKIVNASRMFDGLVVVGMPLEVDGEVFNCAVVIKGGHILGVVPKSYLPNYKEFEEARWYSPSGVPHPSHIMLCEERVPFGEDLLFRALDYPDFVLFLEICEDLWVTIPPSSLARLAGATVIGNLSASNGLIGKADFRRMLVSVQSARCGVYAYAASGIGESSRDLLFDGHLMIAENGTILKENERFEDGITMLIADVDLQRVLFERRKSNSEAENKRRFQSMLNFRTIEFNFGTPVQPETEGMAWTVKSTELAAFEADHEILANFGDDESKWSPFSILAAADGDVHIVTGGKCYPTSKTGKYEVRRKTDKLADVLERYIDPHPFVPSASTELFRRCDEIFKTTTSALIKRLKSVSKRTGKKEVVIGVSGGLDSTLALLKVVRAFDKLGWSRKGIIAYTMPGFGTTARTKGNAHSLMRLLDVTVRELDIRGTCFLAFLKSKHKPFGINVQEIHNQAKQKYITGIKNGTYGANDDVDVLSIAVEDFNERLKDLPAGANDLEFENTQARARTDNLMNKGFVIGTGDLSEIALGWCTYNADHMSMYNVNCSVPKTLVKFLVAWAADNLFEGETRDVLKDIVATKISPELLPTGRDGESKQATEDAVGPYELHDFFLYYMVRWGMSPEKILYLASHAKFDGGYSEETIERWLKTFIRRFFTAQFKRSAVPDGPKIGTISLSPRGDWRMPTDAEWTHWLEWTNSDGSNHNTQAKGDTNMQKDGASNATTDGTAASPSGPLVQKACESGACGDDIKKSACFGNLASPPDTPEAPVEKSALLIVDGLNDFGSKKHGGALPVEGGEEIGEPIGRIQEAEVHDRQVAGNDKHKPTMFNFASNNPEGVTKVADRDGVLTPVWPAHCIENTWGADFLPGIRKDRLHRIFPKGDDDRKDSNSACGNPDLVAYLKAEGITRVDVCGLVYRICVGLTVLDLVKEKFKVRVIKDATRDIELPEYEWVIEQMTILGVEFVTVEQVLAEKRKTA